YPLDEHATPRRGDLWRDLLTSGQLRGRAGSYRSASRRLRVAPAPVNAAGTTPRCATPCESALRGASAAIRRFGSPGRPAPRSPIAFLGVTPRAEGAVKNASS